MKQSTRFVFILCVLCVVVVAFIVVVLFCYFSFLVSFLLISTINTESAGAIRVCVSVFVNACGYLSFLQWFLLFFFLVNIFKSPFKYCRCCLFACKWKRTHVLYFQFMAKFGKQGIAFPWCEAGIKCTEWIWVRNIQVNGMWDQMKWRICNWTPFYIFLNLYIL